MMSRQAASTSVEPPAHSKVVDSAIRHVSDTALWVATSTAKEGQRADAAFDDPLASTLAGERGRAIARSVSRATMLEWGMIIRTSAIDRLINEALSPSRHKLLARYGAASNNTLVITEGVLSYFSMHEVVTLANELHAIPSIRFWIQDFDNAGQRRLPRGWAAKLKAAPILFKVNDWFSFFEQYGWRSSQVITSLEESQRINRPYPIDFPFGLLLRVLPKPMRQKIQSLTGALLMQSTSGPSAQQSRRHGNGTSQVAPSTT
ncbi:MAG: hypothetical protein ACYDBZ_12200 [Steroidobacteraceae bacterium]